MLTGAVSCLLLVLGTLLPLDFASGGGEVTSNHSQLLAFTIIYGLGFGASYSVLLAKPAKMFGKMAEFSKLQAFLMLFQVLGGFCGTLITGSQTSLGLTFQPGSSRCPRHASLNPITSLGVRSPGVGFRGFGFRD